MATHTVAAVILILCLPQAFNFQVPIRKWQNRELHEFRVPRASLLRRYLNQSVDPCDDFYEFACGNWAKSHPVSEDKPIASPLETVKDKVYLELQQLLQEGVTTKDKVAGRRVKDFYVSCMDSQNASQSIRAVFRNFTKHHEGHGMPAIESNWNEHSYNWLVHISALRLKFGIDMLIGLDVKPDTLPNRGNAIYLCEPSIMLPRQQCRQAELDDDLFKEMQKRIVDNMGYWFDMREGDAKRLARELIDFEITLCRGMDENLSVTQAFLMALNEKFPTIDFNYFVSTSFRQPIPQMVSVENEGYFDNLAKVMRTAPPRTIANYIMYRALEAISFPDERDVQKRSRLCIDKAMLFFPDVVGDIYERHFNRPEIKHDVEYMWDRLSNALMQDISSQLWIPETNRRLMNYKLSETRLQFPVYSAADLTHEYRSINISKVHVWRNIQFLLGHMQERHRQKIHFVTSDRNVDFKVDAADTEIVYSDKIIQVPWGLLQSPIYHRTAPVSYKYGTLGFLVAQEAVRGLIESGWKHNPASQIWEWWDATSTQNYNYQVQCFQDQYVNYMVRTPVVSGPEMEDLLKVIVADSSAVNISFHAYLQWLSVTNDTVVLFDETLSDVDYTNTQLFFIAFAQSLCTAKHTDSPSPGLFPWDTPNRHEKFRVNGPLSNMREFAREFNCRPGTEMNPPDKCIVF